MGFQGLTLNPLGGLDLGRGLGEALPGLGSSASPTATPAATSGGLFSFLNQAEAALLQTAPGALAGLGLNPLGAGPVPGSGSSKNSWVQSGVAIVLGIVFVGIGLLLFKQTQTVIQTGRRVAEVAAG